MLPNWNRFHIRIRRKTQKSDKEILVAFFC